MRLTTSEADVLKACLSLLHLRGVMAWRNNTGMLRNRAGRPVSFGKVGSSDILGILPGGRFLAVETKAPGNKPTLAQAAFLDAIDRAGGLAVCVDSPAALAAILDEVMP